MPRVMIIWGRCCSFNFPISKMEKFRHKEIKLMAQGHTADKIYPRGSDARALTIALYCVLDRSTKDLFMFWWRNLSLWNVHKTVFVSFMLGHCAVLKTPHNLGMCACFCFWTSNKFWFFVLQASTLSAPDFKLLERRSCVLCFLLCFSLLLRFR